MLIKGQCGKKRLHVLIDTGSMHNFLNEQLAKDLQCSIDAVKDLTMSFQLQGNNMFYVVINLRQVRTCMCSILSKHWLSTNKIFFPEYDGMFAVQERNDWPELQQLLQSYSDLFQEPKELPPHRDHDHRIIITSGSQPVNARPYRAVMWTDETQHAFLTLKQAMSDVTLQGIIVDLQKDPTSHPHYTWIDGQLRGKPAYADIPASTALPDVFLSGPYPQAILDRRMVKRKNQAATQWLIHWKDVSPTDATWEYADDIQLRFPDFTP
ncbi:hypothetical protein GH714_033903 [Hevea brasiliensis]|uniref:Chromo domain-containing protein n=1 Tax=Hevea brasiliensis TaxID=3981 RepID=A0A6A6LRK4_HEVBR|nr:hypothetical protein GH714_033903 [Hevea brasiliensis]